MTANPHQSLSAIKSLLAAHGLRPKHRLGQNFLHDARKMERIVDAAELRPDDIVLEVGAGTGALSVWLLAAGVRLVAVEADDDLRPILEQQLELRNGASQGASRVALIIGDVLAGKHAINRAVFDALGRAAERAGQPEPAAARYKLVANLPYNVASPLLANLLLAPYASVGEEPSPPQPRMTLGVVTIQREVAERLTAAPGGKDYGPLGVLVQALCQVTRVTTLPPGCFWPAPQVDSVAVRLEPRDTPLTTSPHVLTNLLHRLFSKRRKQLGAILGRNAALPAGIEPNARPEQLSVEQLVALADSGI